MNDFQACFIQCIIEYKILPEKQAHVSLTGGKHCYIITITIITIKISAAGVTKRQNYKSQVFIITKWTVNI